MRAVDVRCSVGGSSVYCRVWYDMTATLGCMFYMLLCLLLRAAYGIRRLCSPSIEYLATDYCCNRLNSIVGTYQSLTWYAIAVMNRALVVMHPSSCCTPRLAFAGGCTPSGALIPRGRRFCASSLLRRWTWRPLGCLMAASRYRTYGSRAECTVVC